MTRPPLLALLVACVLLLSSCVSAHMIELAAGKKECFFEDLHAEDKMTVTYQVGGGGHLDIDFWVSDRPSIEAMRRSHGQEGGGSARRGTSSTWGPAHPCSSASPRSHSGRRGDLEAAMALADAYSPSSWPARVDKRAGISSRELVTRAQPSALPPSSRPLLVHSPLDAPDPSRIYPD